MTVLTPFARTFGGMRRSPGAVILLTVLIVASMVVPLAGGLTVLLFTPALLEAILNGPHTATSAFRASTSRIIPFILWMVGTVFGVGVMVAVVVAVSAAVGVASWTTGPGLAVFLAFAVIVPLVAVVFASLLSTAAAAGLPSPLLAVRRALFSRDSAKSLGTLAILWATTVLLTVMTFLTGVGYSAKSGIGGGSVLAEWVYGWSGTVPDGIFWVVTMVLVVVTLIWSIAVTPAVVASTLGAPAGAES